MKKSAAVVFIGLLMIATWKLEMDGQAKLSLFIFGVMVLLWLLEPIPQVVVSLLGLGAFLLVFPDDIEMVLSGFSSPVLFFVVGSAIVGQAIISTGLADRFINIILRCAESSPKKMISQLILFLPLTPLLLPSGTSRNAVLVPMYESVLQRMRVSKEDPVSKITMLVLGILNPIVSTAFLTGGTAPVIAAKMLGPFSWWQWFSMLALPCLLIFFLGVFYLMIRYPLKKSSWKKQHSIVDIEQPKLPITKSQLIMAGILMMVTILWFTDHWHHLHPAVPVILGTILVFLIPGILKWENVKHSSVWGTYFTLGVLMSFIKIMEKSGIQVWITNLFNAAIPDTANPFLIGLFVIAISAFIHLLIPSIPACLTFTLTLIIHWTQQLGLDPLPYGFISLLTIDAATLYPTQNTTNMIANDMGRTRPSDIFQLGLVLIFTLAIVSLTIGMPIWTHLGRYEG